MEPRARAGKNKGQLNFDEGTLQQFLFAHGDRWPANKGTEKLLDEIVTDFMVEMCFEAHRAAQVAGRQKIKLDDIKFACRKNPTYLGKIHDVIDKKDGIDKARKTLDVNDDKIIKTGGKAIEEDLGEVDDVELETATAGGKSTGTRR